MTPAPAGTVSPAPELDTLYPYVLSVAVEAIFLWISPCNQPHLARCAQWILSSTLRDYSGCPHLA